MGKKIFDNKILHIILAVIISVALWVYVTSLDGNEEEKTIHNIPITFVGEDVLEERGLMIVGNTPTATIKVSAAPNIVVKLNNENLSLRVNVSQITEASEYTLAYTVHLPTGISQSDVNIINGSTGNVSFTVARFSSRQVDVYCAFEGTVAPGFLAGEESEAILADKTITISGESNLVNQVDHALVTVRGENVSDTISGEFPLQLIGVDGAELYGLNVECSADSVFVTYPVLETAEIDLDVKFVTGGGVSEDTIRYTLSTDRIVVAGTKDAIAGIADGSITLATINLSTVMDGDELTYTIPLADELRNISGITEVTITLDLPDDLASSTFDVTEFSHIYLAEGWNAEFLTEQLSIEIRGKESLLTELTADSIRVVADLSHISLAPGQYNVPVKIYIDSTGTSEEIGVMGTEYRVVVQITEA